MPIDMQIKVITRGLNTSEIHLTMTFNLLSVILTVMVGVRPAMRCIISLWWTFMIT